MKILSIDGGGIRGLYVATLLSYLEHDLGTRISDLFDLLVGTSTGGILCLGLTHPGGFSAHDLVDLYLKNAATIFDPKGSGTSLFSPKYDGSGLQSVLHAKFGATPLTGATRPVCVTAFDLVSCQPVFLRSYGPQYAGCDTFADAGCATSAGETFFPAHGNLIDGGNIANNPSVVALAESMARGARLDDVRLLSLGTGRYDPSLANLADGGGFAWAAHVSDVTIDGVAERDAYVAQALLGERYLRVQPMLDEAMSPMDNVSELNMAKLQALAAQVYSDRGAAIREFLK